MRNKILIGGFFLLVLIFVFKKMKSNPMEYPEPNEIESEGAPLFIKPQNTIPKSAHFSASEFRCKDSARTAVPKYLYGNLQALMNNLEIIRTALGNKPITINSGYRTPKHNAAVGGASKSKHLTAMAADIRVSGVSASKVHATIKQLILSGKIRAGGLGKYNSFTHYDVRGEYKHWPK